MQTVWKYVSGIFHAEFDYSITTKESRYCVHTQANLNNGYDICDAGYYICLKSKSVESKCLAIRSLCFQKFDLSYNRCIGGQQSKETNMDAYQSKMMIEMSRKHWPEDVLANTTVCNARPLHIPFSFFPSQFVCESLCDNDVTRCKSTCSTQPCIDGCWHIRHGCIESCAPARTTAIAGLALNSTRVWIEIFLCAYMHTYLLHVLLLSFSLSLSLLLCFYLTPSHTHTLSLSLLPYPPSLSLPPSFSPALSLQLHHRPHRLSPFLR